LIVAREQHNDLLCKAIFYYHEIADLFFVPEFSLVKLSLIDGRVAYVNTALTLLAPELVKIISAKIEEGRGKNIVKLPPPYGYPQRSTKKKDKSTTPQPVPSNSNVHETASSNSAALICSTPPSSRHDPEKRRSVRNFIGHLSLTAFSMDKQDSKKSIALPISSTSSTPPPAALESNTTTKATSRSTALFLSSQMAVSS
jgi:hypothetical protein